MSYLKIGQGSTAELVNIADLALDFTLPGYDIELRVCWNYFYCDDCSNDV